MITVRERIVASYGEQVLKRSALSIRGGAGVFERVLRDKGYRTVVEIGTYRGCSAAEIAQHCRRVVTIDLAHGQLEKMGEPFDRDAMWKALGIDNIDLRLVCDDAEKAVVLRGLRFDLAFIDGAHDAQSVSDDFSMVRRCGRVLFHDYDRRGGPDTDDVYDFVNSLPPHQVEIMDIFALWTDR